MIWRTSSPVNTDQEPHQPCESVAVLAPAQRMGNMYYCKCTEAVAIEAEEGARLRLGAGPRVKKEERQLLSYTTHLRPINV